MNIPFSFLSRLRTKPSWTEIAYGFNRGLISSRTVIEYATDRCAAVDEPSADEFLLASSSRDDSIADIVHRLASQEPLDDRDLQVRWASIILAWLYEHRAEIDDLLGVIEEIYANYDYPEELARFVRYMPTDTPDLGSTQANEARMLDSIGDFAAGLIELDRA
jgi:hypothetical protein